MTDAEKVEALKKAMKAKRDAISTVQATSSGVQLMRDATVEMIDEWLKVLEK